MSEAIDAFGLVLIPALPLLMLLAWCVPWWRCRIECWTPWAALPALLLALGGEIGATVRIDWFLLGSVLELTAINRVFLGFTALLWLGAGLYMRGYLAGDPRGGGFRILWLATMSGNFGLILSQDVASFYAAFALMTFSAYGLVIHNRDAEALSAGRVYLAMALVGEALIIAGLMLAASRSAAPLLPLLSDLPGAIAVSEWRDLTVACLLFGFGIKAGLPLLHMWLPLAHPVAPVPASAVLSGAMIKAGLLGWLSTLPLGLVALPQWGTTMIVLGLVAAFAGAGIGIQQHKAKTVLAYSSISQMGLITVGVGAGLHHPAAWPLLAPAIALYALHHGLAKGALFLGVGLTAHRHGAHRRWLWLALALPGVALAGPMLSGAVAKLALKGAIEADTLPGMARLPDWWAWLPLALSLAAVGTTLLVARYLWLLAHDRNTHTAHRDQWWGWGLVLAASAVGVLLIPGSDALHILSTHAYKLPELLWPALLGIALAMAAMNKLRPLPIPAGDVLYLLLPALRHAQGLPHAIDALARGGEHRLRARILAWSRGHDKTDGRASRLEQGLRRNAGLIFGALLAVALLAGAIGGVIQR